MVLFSALGGCAGNLDPGVGGTSGTAGMGGSGEPCTPNGGTTTPPATFATVQESFRGFGSVSSCASAPCHGANGNAPPGKPLTLQDDANLYMNMMSYNSHACGDIPLVKPGKPNESALIKILTGPCGATPRMPFGCTDEFCLPAENVAAISQWIANCAPPQ